MKAPGGAPAVNRRRGEPAKSAYSIPEVHLIVADDGGKRDTPGAVLRAAPAGVNCENAKACAQLNHRLGDFGENARQPSLGAGRPPGFEKTEFREHTCQPGQGGRPTSGGGVCARGGGVCPAVGRRLQSPGNSASLRLRGRPSPKKSRKSGISIFPEIKGGGGLAPAENGAEAGLQKLRSTLPNCGGSLQAVGESAIRLAQIPVLPRAASNMKTRRRAHS